MKSKLTNKKFYNKWYYKVTLEIKGASIFRFGPMDNIKNLLTTDDDYWRSIWWVRQASENKEIFIDILNLLEPYDKQYGIRVERNWVDFYTNDKALFEKLSDRYYPLVKHRYEPREDIKNTIDQKNAISVHKYPHDVYKLKVFLKPYTIKDDTERSDMCSWLAGQVPNITFSDSVQFWFKNTRYNYDRRYILVNDDATLLMLKLRCHEAVGAVYRYVLNDK